MMRFKETIIHEELRRLFVLFDYLLWLAIDPSKFKIIKHSKIKKILVIHYGAIGELLAITPLISALKKKLNCELEVMVKKGGENVFKENPNISEIIIKKESFKENLEKLKSKDFDMAVIVSPASFKAAFLCLRAGIKYRIGGFGGLNRFPGILFSRRSFPPPKKHAAEKGLDIIRQINIDNLNPKMEFYFSEENKKTAEEKLKKLNVKNYIIIHPGFGVKKESLSRLWPLKRYSKIINYLTEKYNFDVLLTGTKKEILFSGEIYKDVKNKKRVKITNGLFNLEEFGAVISKSKLLIAPSTSAVHIASSFDVPIVNLIAKKLDLYLWHPFMDEKKYKILFSSKTKFNPNVLKEFSNEGMLGIEVKDVARAADELLTQNFN